MPWLQHLLFFHYPDIELLIKWRSTESVINTKLIYVASSFKRWQRLEVINNFSLELFSVQTQIVLIPQQFWSVAQHMHIIHLFISRKFTGKAVAAKVISDITDIVQ